MRIIHTSDWHLGQFFYGKSRAHEHQAFLNWLLTQAKIHHVDAIIVAGDIFDTGTPPSYSREMYFNFIAKLAQLDCQLIVLAGNHDSVAMLGESKTLVSSLSTHVVPMALAQQRAENQQQIDDYLAQQVIEIKDQQGKQQAVICAIPFIRPRDVQISKAGQSAKEKQQTLQQAIADHYQVLFAHAQTLAEDNTPIIATGHLTAVGAKTSDSVRDIYIGTLDAFPANAFPPANYIALGHIHRPQIIGKQDHIRYCGSPIALSFDEAKTDKSVLLVEFTQDKNPVITPLNVPRVQGLAMVKTSLDTLAQDIESIVEQQSKQLTEQLAYHNQALEVNALGLEVTQNMWLDIEISSEGYLEGLHQKINQLTEDLPVEVLLVRRAKKARITGQKTQQHISLSELTVDDVFQQRLAQEDWSEEATAARKPRLELLFNQVVEQLNETPEDTNVDSSAADINSAQGELL